MQVFVVLLRFFDDDGKEKRLLPDRWLARAIKPSVGRLPWTAKGGNDLGGGILGKRFSEGHGEILPQKKKYAMQKKDLDKRPQCRHSLRINQPHRTMKHNRLKIVITANNQTQYFLGDGFWFGRISKAKFEAKLAAGCTIFETVSHLPENVVQFA